jgi:hypothetical protein
MYLIERAFFFANVNRVNGKERAFLIERAVQPLTSALHVAL